ncbi:hypothetical protein QO207_30135 [Pseudomonas sp. CAN2814]|uniref:hypothetical protein n=1 Tax=Pseudomonas sp. CAN1 TaxID=3046726 RepID=UPI0026487180|nr:hypothetical protein [Pseudomonas sp. CAN1]MDN6860872.1 hypothetical protein [Pseudomonas sp. CAN1]
MKAEIIGYEPEIETLAAFVEGRISGAEVDAALKQERMRSLLAVFVDAKYPASSDFNRKLDVQDRSSLGGLVNSEGFIQQFLELASVEFKPECPHGKLYSLLLTIQPAWLDLDPEFVQEHVLPREAGLSKTERTRRAKARIKELFQCAGKPPSWIQNPEWPMHADVPAVFIGQMPIKAPELFHDDGVAYLFFDKASGQFETVTQFY